LDKLIRYQQRWGLDRTGSGL